MEWYFSQFIKDKIDEGLSDADIAVQVPYTIADVASVRAMHNGPWSELQLNNAESLKSNFAKTLTSKKEMK